MGTSDDMKKLGEDIVASYDMRIKAVGELVKDTHKMLKEFQASNRELFDNVHNMLSGFQREHEEMSATLKADLAKGEEDRLRDFKTMMKSVRDFVSDMIQGTARLMQQIRKEQKGRNKAVSDLLAEFASDHQAMADQLEKDLTKAENERIKDFKPMMASIQKYVKDVARETKRLISEIQARQDERNREVLDLLQEFQTEREKMAANWQALTATMAKRREGHPAPPQFETRKKMTTTTVEQILGEGKPKRKTAKKRPAKKRPAKKELVHSLN